MMATVKQPRISPVPLSFKSRFKDVPTDPLPLTVIDAVTWNQENQTLRIGKPLSEAQTVDLAMSLIDETNRNALAEALGMQPQAFVKEKAPAELGENF